MLTQTCEDFDHDSYRDIASAAGYAETGRSGDDVFVDWWFEHSSIGLAVDRINGDGKRWDRWYCHYPRDPADDCVIRQLWRCCQPQEHERWGACFWNVYCIVWCKYACYATRFFPGAGGFNRVQCIWAFSWAMHDRTMEEIVS